MGAFGTIVNFAAAVAALALAGPYWGVIVFLSIALVRITLDAHMLRRDHELLQEHVARLESSPDLEAEVDAPPESGTRPSRTFLEKRAS
jgi:membrane protein implicated in regulation of membrane protease activity